MRNYKWIFISLIIFNIKDWRCGWDLNPRSPEGKRLSKPEMNIEELLSNLATWFHDNKVGERTIKDRIAYSKRFLLFAKELSIDEAKRFLSKYDNANTYNNALQALRFLFRFMNIGELPFKQRDNRPSGLVIAPKVESVLALINNIEDISMKAYLVLCSTTGLRCQRIFKLTWDEINFEEGLIIPKNGNVRTKNYRPNPIHPIALNLLQKLPRTSNKVFNFSDKRVRKTIDEAEKKLGFRITPCQLRDFFYNTARKIMDRDLVEYLMGHRLGIREHYLADEVKTEYEKFIRAFPLNELVQCPQVMKGEDHQSIM